MTDELSVGVQEITRAPLTPPRKAKYPKSLRDGLDAQSFAKIAPDTPDRHDKKYLDLEWGLKSGWQQLAHLHLKQPSDILDIGTGPGPGFFVYVAQQMGHRCAGLDQPDCIPFMVEIRRWLGIRVTDHEIKASQPMPKLGRFDVVTAYRAQFNRSNGRLWSTDEWCFFLDDLRDNVLKPGGRLVIKFAKQDLKAARGGLSPSDPLMQAFLESRGAVTTNGITDFNPLI